MGQLLDGGLEYGEEISDDDLLHVKQHELYVGRKIKTVTGPWRRSREFELSGKIDITLFPCRNPEIYCKFVRAIISSSINMARSRCYAESEERRSQEAP